MAASLAVFETYELLENIVTHLPAREIFEARCVSSAWRTVIDRESKGMRVAKCATPIKEPSDLDCLLCTPMYGKGTNLQITHVLDLDHFARPHEKIPTKMRVFAVPDAGDTKVETRRADFVTKPRCQAVAMHACSYNSATDTSMSNACIVYNKEGIRVADVLHARDALSSTIGERTADTRFLVQCWLSEML